MKWPWKTTASEYQPGRDWQRLAALFPQAEASAVQAALALLPLDTSRKLDNGQWLRPADFFSEKVVLLAWQGTPLAIPYRLSVQEPAPEVWACLPTQQQQLLHCLYLRHYAGYVRQRHLEALLALTQGAPAAYTVPFPFRLVGEYVQEILGVLVAHLTPALLASYGALIRHYVGAKLLAQIRAALRPAPTR